MRRILVAIVLTALGGCHSTCSKDSAKNEAEPAHSARAAASLSERRVGLHPKLHASPIGHRIHAGADAAADADAGE